MSIAENRDEILDLIRDEIEVVAAGDPVGEVGESFESLSESFQALAICNLLLSADTAGFFKNAVTSGYTRRFFLRRGQSERTDYHAISRTDAIFDVVAAGEMDLAREIIALSPDEWIEDGEYKDDFCYYAFIHGLTASLESPETARLAQLLESFEQAVTPDTEPRFAVCTSLVARNAPDFLDTFAHLLAIHQAKLDETASDFGDDPRFKPRCAVFVEGLALLRLASAWGITPSTELPLCPALVLDARAESPIEDIYADIAALIE